MSRFLDPEVMGSHGGLDMVAPKRSSTGFVAGLHRSGRCRLQQEFDDEYGPTRPATIRAMRLETYCA